MKNPSFEQPVVQEPGKTIEGWEIKTPGAEILAAKYKNTVVGTKAGGQFLRFGVDGQGGAVSQTLDATVKPGAYTLQFHANRVFNDSNMTRPLTVELLAGEQVLESMLLSEDKICNGNEIGTEQSAQSLTAHVRKDAAEIGKPLALRLSGGAKNGFGMVAVDDLRLTYDADATAPAPYQLNVADAEYRSTDPLPGMGGVAADGTRYGVDGERWTRNGKPWYPVSGEFHYARYPEAEWSRELAKMKALGVDIVATYVFWNHHENPKGTWNWQDRLNLRRFVEAARENGLLVWLRLGPYINAEAKNGGIPEFANKGKRSNSPDYLPLVEEYYGTVSAQLKGLFVKDGGPIVGIQLDNEFAGGDPKHITKLKEIAIAKGMTAPYWTVTANSRFERMTAIPLQGSYTYRGWEGGGGTHPTSGFSFSTDEWTANTDLGGTFYDTKDYPRGFCELGTGSPMNAGSRFLVEADYVLAQAWDCVGRGTNYLGYYMFHGGVQYPGMNGGNWPLTYDFQAPLGEFGQIRESGHLYRRLHTFVTEFAPELTKARAVRDPKQNPDPKQTARLRHIGRFAGNRGFWFVNNTQRNLTLPTRKDVQVSVNTGDGKTMDIPAEPMVMPDRRYNVFPVHLDLGGIDLLWATVQPFARLENPGELPCTVFWLPDWTRRELCFPKSTKITVESGHAEIQSNNTNQLVSIKSTTDRVSLLVTTGSVKARVLLISDEDSRHGCVVRKGTSEVLLVSKSAEITAVVPQVKIQGLSGSEASIEIYPGNRVSIDNAWKSAATRNGWVEFRTTLPKAGGAPAVSPAGDGLWNIAIAPGEIKSLSHAYLELPYQGNEAQLVSGGSVLTNDFFHKASWIIDLKRYQAELQAGSLQLRISGASATPGTPRWLPMQEVVLTR